MTRRSLLAGLTTLVPVALAASDAAASLTPDRVLQAQAAAPAEGDRKQQDLMAAERAFAKTMADRDHSAFASFVAEEGVFLGAARAMKGRADVAAGWKRYFEGPKAPFSWEPERAEVLPSGTLGMTTGPVRDPEGKRTGTFITTWRLEADGKWRVVFDTGCPPCECK